jgi:hypothetical protein
LHCFIIAGKVREEKAGMGGRRKAKTSVPIDEEVNFHSFCHVIIC